MTGERRHLRVDRPADGVLRVTLDRPEVRNAFDTAMAEEIRALFAGLGGAGGDGTRCVVLTGAGEKAFCAGADLKQREGLSDAQWLAQHTLFERMMVAVLDCPIPVIAAVNGAAMGGGFELMLCCDLAYGAESARFALPEVSRGIMPGGGGTQTLPRAIGAGRAREMIFSGRAISARRAYEWGVLNRVCAPERLLPETLELAASICANAPLAIRRSKKAIGLGLQTDLRSAMELEIEIYDRLIPTEDRREGVRAFVEKRAPRFKGR